MNRRHHQRHNTSYKPPFRLKNRRVSIINLAPSTVKKYARKEGKLMREKKMISRRKANENPWRIRRNVHESPSRFSVNILLTSSMHNCIAHKTRHSCVSQRRMRTHYHEKEARENAENETRARRNVTSATINFDCDSAGDGRTLTSRVPLSLFPTSWLVLQRFFVDFFPHATQTWIRENDIPHHRHYRRAMFNERFVFFLFDAAFWRMNEWKL